MAIIDSKGRLHGKLGNVVYRTVGKTAIVQSKAGEVKQTAATKQSAMEFGLASNCSKIIRTAFFPLTYTADGGMINRLNGAVLKCIKNSENQKRGERDLHDGDLKFLEGFQFNRYSPLNSALKIRPIAELDSSNRIRVQIPAFKDIADLLHPIHSQSCVLRLMILAINFRDDYYQYTSYIDIEIAKRELFLGHEWRPEEVLPSGSIAFVSASLHYYGASGMVEEAISLNSRECSPAELLAAFKVPPAESETDNDDSAVAGDGTLNRFPLNNYRGREILKDLQKLRQQQQKKQDNGLVITGKVKSKPLVLPKGKIQVQKE